MWLRFPDQLFHKRPSMHGQYDMSYMKYANKLAETDSHV